MRNFVSHLKKKILRMKKMSLRDVANKTPGIASYRQKMSCAHWGKTTWVEAKVCFYLPL